MREDVLFNQNKHLGIITLNRSEALNALSLPMISSIQQHLSQWKASPSVHAVVIQATGDQAFCAGGDVRWLYQSKSDAKQLDFFWQEYRLNHFIHHFGKPYIALMDGLTMGGGVGISMHGSHPIASERFLFAMPETGIGFFPDIGASYLLNRCPEHYGLYLGLTGNRLDHKEAKALGLVKEILPSNLMRDFLERLADEDLSKDAHTRVDDCLKVFALSKEEATTINPLINKCFSKPTLDLVLQSLQEVNEAWSNNMLRQLEKKSPLSLKVTFEQLKKTAGKSLSDCLKMDYTLVQHFMKANDFYEGIRALLIDKDKNPRWDPPSLDLVRDGTIINYFERHLELTFT